MSPQVWKTIFTGQRDATSGTIGKSCGCFFFRYSEAFRPIEEWNRSLTECGLNHYLNEMSQIAAQATAAPNRQFVGRQSHK